LIDLSTGSRKIVTLRSALVIIQSKFRLIPCMVVFAAQCPEALISSLCFACGALMWQRP
jgi:hypothetical protein